MKSTPTVRQLEILQLSARGLTAREIAKALEISKGTVKIHLANARTRLQVATTVEACCECLKRNLIY